MSKENMLITDGEPCASIRCKHGSGARAARPLAYVRSDMSFRAWFVGEV